MAMLSHEELSARLQSLRQKHCDIDSMIRRVESLHSLDQLGIKRLKKRKLLIRDEISRIEDTLFPDIIA